MRFIHLTGILIGLTWFMAACQPTPPPCPTGTPYPTYTPYPTASPYPTYTPPAMAQLPSADIENLVWPTGPRDDVIPFTAAADFIGQKMTVEGKVIKTHNSGKVVFLNFSPTALAFTAVIFAEAWPAFPSPPETLFVGKLVRVEGAIEEYQGAPEIVIRDPGQIEVALTLGQAVFPCAPPQRATEVVTLTPTSAATALITPAATATTPLSAQPAIAWQDASAYAGQTVTIAGQVVDTYKSDKVVFLNFAKEYATTFKVVIFADAWPLFPFPPADYYRAKTIRVTGQVKIYQNAPEIIVDRPDQIELME
jgi:DNA/RNA endonuclease YhcR with UshA esterase domain